VVVVGGGERGGGGVQNNGGRGRKGRNRKEGRNDGAGIPTPFLPTSKSIAIIHTKAGALKRNKGKKEGRGDIKEGRKEGTKKDEGPKEGRMEGREGTHRNPSYSYAVLLLLWCDGMVTKGSGLGGFGEGRNRYFFYTTSLLVPRSSSVCAAGACTTATMAYAYPKKGDYADMWYSQGRCWLQGSIFSAFNKSK
jgi:hypothetical protein